MTLYPFTPTGVQDRLDELYSKPKEIIELEAVSIEIDFSSWIENNFDLDSTQKSFLHGIKEEALNYFGSQCALCFRHKLPIILIYPTPPEPGYAKWPETSNDIRVIADSNGNISVTGSLTFTMVFEPKN